MCLGKTRVKYEQFVNVPENRKKIDVVRIFRQILAKMRLESQCDFGRFFCLVEMKEARSGR